MRRLIFGITVGAALLLAAPASTASVSVGIGKTGFAPRSITVDLNDTVTWKNNDTVAHQVVANSGAFASPVLGAGKTYTLTARRAGTFGYHDALHPALKGTLKVNGPPPQVTLATSAPVVKYGGQVTLTGSVSSKKAGETVTLVQLPMGQTNKQVVATLQTAANGVFTFAVSPQIYTTYQAQWKNLESSVIVQVQPTIKLPPAVRGFFHFTVAAGTSFAGHWVFLQRWSPLQGRWLSYRRLVLGAKSGRIFPVTYAPRHARTSLRIFLPQEQAGPGYLETVSASQPVKRR
jgi:plastocyanin